VIDGWFGVVLRKKRSLKEEMKKEQERSIWWMKNWFTYYENSREDILLESV
jgi:hypothetical protein